MRQDDGGQLLLLAGIVLVMAFVVTAFTLGQVADVEKEASKEQDQSFLTEYRFVHSKLPSIVSGNTGRTTDNVSFNTTFATTIQSFRNGLASKGYDASIFVAGNASAAEKAECTWMSNPLTACAGSSGAWRSVVPSGGTQPFDARLPYDGKSDGLVWMCGQANGALVGVVVQVYLSDGRHSVAETLVVALNTEFYNTEIVKPSPCS